MYHSGENFEKNLLSFQGNPARETLIQDNASRFGQTPDGLHLEAGSIAGGFRGVACPINQASFLTAAKRYLSSAPTRTHSSRVLEMLKDVK